MIIIVDALNKHEYEDLLDRMFELRGRVFGGRLGWEVEIRNGRDIDQFDALDPGYVIGVDDDGEVISCVRAVQTTGPHMLADVFSAILGGEPPLRSPTLWEATRFCVDTGRIARGSGTVSTATSELMIGALEWAMGAGIEDIIAVVDPVMNRILQRSGNGPYDYIGSTVQMGKVPAMAGLIDCTQERLDRVRAFSGISHDVFATEEQAERLKDKPKVSDDALLEYLENQLDGASSPQERDAVRRMWSQLIDAGVADHLPPAEIASLRAH